MGLLLLITALTIATIAFIVIRKSKTEGVPLEPISTTNPISEVSIPLEVVEELEPTPRFEVQQVDRDCELKEFIEDNKLEFRRGCTFYEFIHEIENISNKQEVVLKDKVSTMNNKRIGFR